jgi:hypothetical protein
VGGDASRKQRDELLARAKQQLRRVWPLFENLRIANTALKSSGEHSGVNGGH